MSDAVPTPPDTPLDRARALMARAATTGDVHDVSAAEDFSVRLARSALSEEAVEKLARIFSPHVWAAIDRDAHLIPNKPKLEWLKARPSVTLARAALAALVEMGGEG